MNLLLWLSIFFTLCAAAVAAWAYVQPGRADDYGPLIAGAAGITIFGGLAVAFALLGGVVYLFK